MNSLLRIIFLICYVFLLVLLYLPSYENFSVDLYSCQQINCSETLQDLLKTSTTHRCAFYDLEDDGIYELVQEGVLFEDNYEAKYSRLTQVNSKGLMHHKYCVFDERYVLSGSWNPTRRGTNYNDNYILFIDSKSIAKKYSEEYEHLQDRSISLSPLHIRSKTESLELYFCPQHDCQQQVRETIQRARESVHMLSFTFTDELIAEDLLALSRNGVAVEIIYEKTRITRYSTIRMFDNSLVNTHLDANPYTMHEKMIIIDNETIIVGSYNPTKGATLKNDENILIITDRKLAQNALDEYYRVLSLINT